MSWWGESNVKMKKKPMKSGKAAKPDHPTMPSLADMFKGNSSKKPENDNKPKMKHPSMTPPPHNDKRARNKMK